MKPYTLLVIGHHAPIWAAFLSVQVLTHHIAHAFGRLQHVRVVTSGVDDWTAEGLAHPADVVLVIAYWREWSDDLTVAVKDCTGAGCVVSLREVPFPVDHSFVFKPTDSQNTTYIPLPCAKRRMKQTPKVPGSVLIDHVWNDYIGTDLGWTDRIERWIEPIADSFAVSRMIYYTDRECRVPSFVTPFPSRPYPKYLADTSHFERFICTHAECYPHGVIDMAARGTQVLAPVGLLPDCVVADLGIPTFSTCEELLDLLAKPVGPEWASKVDKCTDFANIASIMDAKCQEVLA